MIAYIEALNYRCLRYVRQGLGPFQVLVGPNASGKSTFLDAIALLGDLLDEGLAEAIRKRSPDLRALTWMGKGERFEVAVELIIPDERRRLLPRRDYARARYEVAIGANSVSELVIVAENLWIKPHSHRPHEDPQLPLAFPEPLAPPVCIFREEGKRPGSGWKKVVTRRETGNSNLNAETTRWNHPFRFSAQTSALANLPGDEDLFPVATWVRSTLVEGIQRLALNSDAMRRPAPPSSPLEFRPDGSNLPRVIEDFRNRSGEAFERWIAHLRTALPDLKSVDTIERPEDRHRYLQINYNTGLSAPSWTVSDGTLRLLALTLLAYLEGSPRAYLIEEPENGIHPLAVETVFQALSSAYNAQILCASHSPVVLSRAEPDQLLCFAKTDDGATDIRRGSEHPMLRDWKRGADLGTLFASGVLG